MRLDSEQFSDEVGTQNSVEKEKGRGRERRKEKEEGLTDVPELTLFLAEVRLLPIFEVS